MVDMFIQLEQAISMTYMATIKLSEPAAERAKLRNKSIKIKA